MEEGFSKSRLHALSVVDSGDESDHKHARDQKDQNVQTAIHPSGLKDGHRDFDEVVDVERTTKKSSDANRKSNESEHLVILPTKSPPRREGYVVGLVRVELTTSALSVLRSNQLSYSPVEGTIYYAVSGSLCGGGPSQILVAID